ncbi:hypothetical protein GCM10008942_01950 [Rhizomicrobium electricum]|uniref:Uncharacterized protein n=1 Tax=Rhizomicrobium electricum TaxID=480070 RepID=A0ABN1E268_9PROT
MAFPVAGRDLVPDQEIGGLVVGHAQQRLGETHQRDAFLGRQRVFLRQSVNTTPACALAANATSEITREDADSVIFLRIALCGGNPLNGNVIFIGEVRIGDGLTS